MTGWLVAVAVAAVVWQAAAAPISKNPYVGAIAVDARTGAVLFEDGADRPAYPASMLKLMDMFLVLDRVREGTLRLDDMVRVTKEAANMGGSQVWLDPRESFSIDELLYALMVQSANDAAMALAIHVGGSRDAWVGLMNAKARELGLSQVTRFQSPHGLPPGKGQRPDLTTPRDFAKLCQALLAVHPEVLKYTSTTVRLFRPDAANPVEMRNHNPLLRGQRDGLDECDGLKTGYFADAGYSIALTGERDGARAIVVIMGCQDKKVRNAKGAELLRMALAKASRGPVAPVEPAVVAPAAPEAESAAVAADEAGEEADGAEGEEEGTGEAPKKSRFWPVAGIVVLVLAGIVGGMVVQRRLLLR
jgi:D-alanyl-D-alanine carboxypeptidase (penicillin-binding protein 5/6)